MTSFITARSKRNLLIDAGKGLGILLVVFGHTIQKSFPDFDNIGFRLVYSFHMPLFMLLSGCVAKYGDSRSITKNVTRLVLPFLAWYIVGDFVHWYQLGGRPNFYGSMVALFKNPDWGLWFLWVLFLCHTCFYAMAFAQKYGGVIAAGLVFILIQFIPLNILGVGLLKWHFVFFVAGYCVMRYQAYIIRRRYYLMPLAALVYFVLFPYWQFVDNKLFLNEVADHIQIGKHAASYLEKLFRYLTAFAGIGVVMSLVYFIMKYRPIGVFLTMVGLYTLEIYVSQQLLLGYAFGQSLWLKMLTEFVNAIVLSLGLAYILKQIPIIGTVLYGIMTEKPINNVLPDGARN